jgi:hypothetical protein
VTTIRRQAALARLIATTALAWAPLAHAQDAPKAVRATTPAKQAQPTDAAPAKRSPWGEAIPLKQRASAPAPATAQPVPAPQRSATTPAATQSAPMASATATPSGAAPAPTAATPATTIAPAADGGPWKLEAGLPIHVQLRAWAERANWTLVWKPSRSWVVPAKAEFRGRFDEAVEQVVLNLAAEGKPVHLNIWEGNHVVEIFEVVPR